MLYIPVGSGEGYTEARVAPVLLSVSLRFLKGIEKLSKSSDRPLRSSALGYSQSISTPSKSYVDINCVNETKNFI